MKKINLVLLFSLVNFMAFSQSIKVNIKQDGKVIKPVNNTYELKKSTFAFEITSTDLEGFLIGATTDESIFDSAVARFDPNISWFQNTGLAEELYNVDQELFLMDLAPSYWYYTDAKDHRFDKNPVGNTNQWTAQRTVKRFYDIMVDRPIDIKSFAGSVYVFMYQPEYNEEYDLIARKNLFQAVLKFRD